MKQLVLKNAHHERLIDSFRGYLKLRGYGEHSIYHLPYFVKEFLHWLEQKGLRLEVISYREVSDYFGYLEERKNQRREGGLSNCYLHKHVQGLKLFSSYLKQTEQYFFEVGVQLSRTATEERIILTRAEMNLLYAQTEQDPLLGLRDRAMLSIYYGCGLRRSEGVCLDVEDVLFRQGLLYVRAGKNNKERYVPMSEGVKKDLTTYLHYWREQQGVRQEECALLLGRDGDRLQGQSALVRLKYLLTQARVEKKVGLHSLRHSIATHLMQSGMSLKHIAKFLGHTSLESTQIYTHLSDGHEF